MLVFASRQALWFSLRVFTSRALSSASLSPLSLCPSCPQVMKGKDVLGCAETGSGKTAAFALPILHELSKDPYG